MAILAPSLLITDDDAAFREALQGVFEPQGFRTLLAGDGEQALKIVRTEVVHLVLLDMHMPKLTGLETLRLVKQVKAMLPCIILSADLDEVLIEQARRAHAFSVLPKPISGRAITGIVRQALKWAYNWPAGQPNGLRPVAGSPECFWRWPEVD
ncbi:MAG: response regulator [Thermoguttaceae bacterium]